MHLVLDEKVDERHQRSEEGPRQPLPVFDGLCVRWAERDAAERPGQGGDDVRDHEDVVPVVVVCRRDVCPPAARQGPQETHDGDELWKPRAGLSRQEVPQAHEREPRPRRDGDEHHEEGPLRVPVTDGRGHRRKPFFRVAVELVLDYLVVVQRNADDECAEEGG